MERYCPFHINSEMSRIGGGIAGYGLNNVNGGLNAGATTHLGVSQLMK